MYRQNTLKLSQIFLCFISIPTSTSGCLKLTPLNLQGVVLLISQCEDSQERILIAIINPTITLLPLNRPKGRNPHMCGINQPSYERQEVL